MRGISALLILVVAFVAGCADRETVTDDGAGSSEAPAPAPAPALAPQAMREMLQKRQECALASFQRQGYSGADYPRILIGKVSVDQAQADARTYAAGPLDFYERINPAQTEYARLENAIHAIGDVASATKGDEAAQLKAMALVAYYESHVTGTDCPVDERILRIVHK